GTAPLREDGGGAAPSLELDQANLRHARLQADVAQPFVNDPIRGACRLAYRGTDPLWPMLRSRWKLWTDHYARSGDWPRIRAMRESKTNLILNLEEAKGAPLIEPFIVGASIDNIIASRRERN